MGEFPESKICFDIPTAIYNILNTITFLKVQCTPKVAYASYIKVMQ